MQAGSVGVGKMEALLPLSAIWGSSQRERCWELSIHRLNIFYI